MTLNDMLKAKNIDPAEVLVLRHSPSEPQLNRELPWLAASRPELFNAYQRTQNAKTEKAMLKSKYVASFVAQKSNRALFIGLFRMNGGKLVTRIECMQMPESIELIARGMTDHSTDPDSKHRPSYIWFDLVMDESFYPDWRGKLIIDWPAPAIAWYRLAKDNTMPIHAILDESALSLPVPIWNEIVLDYTRLNDLPPSWQIKMSQWRGIYYIFDKSDRMGYVGSAYGSENLIGRWKNYAASGHGGNKLLKSRDPNNLTFSILQILPHDTEPDVVINLENTWKERLHTRFPDGLNSN